LRLVPMQMVFWLLLSGNSEVAFPSRVTTIVAAANFPTPGTAAATYTSTTNVAAVTTSVISALTTTAADSVPRTAAASAPSARTPCTASTSDPTGAANVATSSADKRRNAGSYS
jgi:hypothetical protein